MHIHEKWTIFSIEKSGWKNTFSSIIWLGYANSFGQYSTKYLFYWPYICLRTISSIYMKHNYKPILAPKWTTCKWYKVRWCIFNLIEAIFLVFERHSWTRKANWMNFMNKNAFEKQKRTKKKNISSKTCVTMRCE